MSPRKFGTTSLLDLEDISNIKCTKGPNSLKNSTP